MYVESGSSVVLRCVISNWLEKPQIVFWFHDGDRLARGPDTAVKERRDQTSIVSLLTITGASARKHSGRYECSPDNIKPASINLHVIEGTYSTASATLNFFCSSPFISCVRFFIASLSFLSFPSRRERGRDAEGRLRRGQNVKVGQRRRPLSRPLNGGGGGGRRRGDDDDDDFVGQMLAMVIDCSRPTRRPDADKRKESELLLDREATFWRLKRTQALY